MTIANEVRVYLKNKPYVTEALQKGIVNFSALARYAAVSLGVRNLQAVKAAVVRYAAEVAARKGDIEAQALPVLKANRVTLLDGVSVIISSAKLGIENDAEVKLDSYYVYMTRRDAMRGMGKAQRKSVVRVNSNCSAIVLYSEEKLEDVPGVIAFLSSLLAEAGINVLELISCYTETILVVRKEDAVRAYTLVSELTG